MAAKNTELEIQGLISEANAMVAAANRFAADSYKIELTVEQMSTILSKLDERAQLIKAKRVEIEGKIAKLPNPDQAQQFRDDLHALTMATPLISRDLLAAKCKLTELRELKQQQTEAMQTFEQRSLAYSADPKKSNLTVQMLAQNAAGIDAIDLAVAKLNMEATAIFSPFRWKSGSELTAVQRKTLEQLQEEHTQLLKPNAADGNLRLLVAAQQIIAFDRRFSELMRSFSRSDDRSINEQKLTEMRELKVQIALRTAMIKPQLEKRIKAESRPEERKQLADALEQITIINKALVVDRKTNNTSYDRVIERTAERLGMTTQVPRAAK